MISRSCNTLLRHNTFESINFAFINVHPYRLIQILYPKTNFIYLNIAWHWANASIKISRYFNLSRLFNFNLYLNPFIFVASIINCCIYFSCNEYKFIFLFILLSLYSVKFKYQILNISLKIVLLQIILGRLPSFITGRFSSIIFTYQLS